MLSRDTHIIAVCCAAVDTNYNKHYMQYFTEFADKYHLKYFIFVLLVTYTWQPMAENTI